jgi:hypothetical protein
MSTYKFRLAWLRGQSRKDEGGKEEERGRIGESGGGDAEIIETDLVFLKLASYWRSLNLRISFDR